MFCSILIPSSNVHCVTPFKSDICKIKNSRDQSFVWGRHILHLSCFRYVSFFLVFGTFVCSCDAFQTYSFLCDWETTSFSLTRCRSIRWIWHLRGFHKSLIEFLQWWFMGKYIWKQINNQYIWLKNNNQQKVGLNHGLLVHEKRLPLADIPKGCSPKNSNSDCLYRYLVAFLKMGIMQKNKISISCAPVYLLERQP